MGTRSGTRRGCAKDDFTGGWLVGALTRIASVSRFTDGWSANSRCARQVQVPAQCRRWAGGCAGCIGAAVADDPDRSPAGAGEREKNVHEMIAAVAIVKERLPGVKYEIIGGGALRPELEALAKKLGVADAVTFLGQVGDRGIARGIRTRRRFRNAVKQGGVRDRLSRGLAIRQAGHLQLAWRGERSRRRRRRWVRPRSIGCEDSRPIGCMTC